MFIVDSLSIKVSFKHYPVTEDDKISFETVCSIVPTGQKAPFICGVAFCSKKDQFNKEVGRKLALKRALDRNLANWDKIQRTIIWKAYFNRSKNEFK
jgi:hypothetical protein